MGNKSDQSIQNAEDLETGSTISKYKELAKKYKIWLSLGGFHEKSKKHDKIYNSHLIIDDLGEIKAIYRKIHLFKVDIPGGVSLDESITTDPGEDIIVCPSPVGNLGLSTCYDIRFPELYSSLRKKGAEIILIPSAFTVPTGKAHWEVLTRARAIETQCYVIAAAQCGVHNERRSSYGHSCVIDPWGKVIVDMEEAINESVECEVDLQLVYSAREKIPIINHRREDIYKNN